jgi:hypothetical protein
LASCQQGDLESPFIEGELFAEEPEADSGAFQLTSEFDLPIVMSLRAEGPSPVERWHKMAQRIGNSAHTLSKFVFDMADAISRIPTHIETTTDKDPLAVLALNMNSASGPIHDIKTIITHWSITTGHALKSKKVSAN